ncbi:hypothetical protein Leryth_020737 [Lithospermum erythrorhizon]|nr:hypothetical protein Leryth_020737 [Lithospermum erythrorhizon]
MLSIASSNNTVAVVKAASFRSLCPAIRCLNQFADCPFKHLFSARYCRLYSHSQVKAMAEALTTATPDSKFSVSGKKQALISLSDKKDLDLLGKGLQDLGYTIVSTGGTASTLSNSGVSVTKVEELTHFPEMLDGRVKTLHPNIHGGILARRDQDHHMEALDKHGIGTFDVVVVNLYPFYSKVSSSSGISFDDGIENIDIGGPAMIRAAAKNHKDVLIVVDTEDYPALLDYLKGKQDDPLFRRKLAWKAFQHVASYDSAVSEWLWKQSGGDKFPPSLTVPLSIKSSLRYGENPHQKAAFYVDKSLAEFNAGGIATAVQHHGKCETYNSCGVVRENIIEAYRLAVKADPVSFFVYKVPFDKPRCLHEIAVVAPKYTEKGLEVLRGKSKTLRILEASKNNVGKLSLRQVGGGWLAQDSDDLTPEEILFKVMSERTPQDNELAERPYSWKDAVEEACESGVGVIAEPGGSIRDGDAVDCCNKYGVSLVFTDVRHFRH